MAQEPDVLQEEQVDSIQDDVDEFLANEDLAPSSRAQSLIYEIVDKGLDYMPVVTKLVGEADSGRKNAGSGMSEEQAKFLKLMREILKGPQTVERITHICETTNAVITTAGDGQCFLQLHPDIIKDDVWIGDIAIVASKIGMITRTYPPYPMSGITGKVADFVGDGRCTVGYGSETIVLIVPQNLKFEKGDEIIYDMKTRCVIEKLETTREPATHLLCPADDLKNVDPEAVGAKHPVLNDIMRRVTILMDIPGLVQEARRAARVELPVHRSDRHR